MKLDKDKIQKIALSVIGAGIAFFVYFNFLLGPLARNQEVAKQSIEKTHEQIEEGKKKLQELKNLETKSRPAEQKVEALKSMIPEGAPVAWFPPQITAFFKSRGIEKVAVRLNNEVAEKDLPGFRKLFWALELPKVEFVPLAMAIAALENEQPLLEINNLQIEQSKESVQYQRVVMTVSTLVRN
jgi:hypothetical protein